MCRSSRRRSAGDENILTDDYIDEVIARSIKKSVENLLDGTLGELDGTRSRRFIVSAPMACSLNCVADINFNSYLAIPEGEAFTGVPVTVYVCMF